MTDRRKRLDNLMSRWESENDALDVTELCEFIILLRDEYKRIAELEAQVGLSDSLLRLLWSWAPALQHRTSCEMADHPGPGCICTCGRDSVLTQIDGYLARTAPKEPNNG